MEPYCRICGDLSDGLHFTVPACRACTAFFRRSVSQAKQYSCRFGGQCNIGKDVRCFCRACRMQKCLAAGMKTCSVQMHRDESGKRESKPIQNLTTSTFFASSASTDDSSPCSSTAAAEPAGILLLTPPLFGASAHSPGGCIASTSDQQLSISCKMEPAASSVQSSVCTTPIRFGSIDSIVRSPQPSSRQPQCGSGASRLPLLNRMLDGYRSLAAVRRAARNLTSNTAFHRIFDDKEIPTLGTMDDSMRSFRADITFVSDMVNEFFDPFATLPTDQKWLFFKNFFAAFICTDRSFLTAQMFPSKDDDRFAITTEKYHSVKNLVPFFQCESCKSDPVEVAKLFAVSWSKWNRLLVHRMIDLQLTEIEIVAIFGLLFWCETVDGLTASSTEMMCANRDRIFSELYQHLVDQCHGLEIGLRFGSIMTLLSHCEECPRKLGEDFSVAKVFNIYSMDSVAHDFFQA